MDQMKFSSIPHEDVINIVKKMPNREYIEIYRSCKALKNLAEKRQPRPVLQCDPEKTLTIHFFVQGLSRKITVTTGLIINVDLYELSLDQQDIISSTLSSLKEEVFTSVRISSAVDTILFTQFCFKTSKLLKEHRIRAKHLNWDIEDRPEQMCKFLEILECASLSTGVLKDVKFLHTNDKIVSVRTKKPLFDPILFSKCMHVKFSLFNCLENEVFLCQRQLCQFTKTMMILHSFDKYQESLAEKSTLKLGVGSLTIDTMTNSYTKDAIIDYTKRVCKENSFQNIYDVPSDEYEDNCRIHVCYGVLDTSLTNSNGHPVPLVLSSFFYIYHFNGRMRCMRASLNFRIVRSMDQLRFGAQNLPFSYVAPPSEFVKFKQRVGKRYFALKKKRSFLRFFSG